MLELLILLVLLEEKNTIYGIRQKIEKRFSLFMKVSFGALHPALKKLEKSKRVSVNSRITSGGQRRLLYSITASGKDYFTSLMTENLPENPALASQLINIKIMAISKIDSELQKQVIKSILNHLKYQKAESLKLLNTFDEINETIQRKFIKNYIQKISDDIQWLGA